MPGTLTVLAAVPVEPDEPDVPVEPDEPDVPVTGDGSNPVLYGAIALLALGIALTLKRKKTL